MVTATCKACDDPLTLTLEPEEPGDEGQTVPDDLLLPCGCHFHWQCLLDQSTTVAASLRCPSCTSYLPSNTAASSSSSSSSTPSQPQQTPILTRYTNEGGVQESLDIFPALAEESFLTAHPEARPARALHTLASEGDAQGVVELLADVEGDADADGMSAGQLLAWRDPLNGLRSALHVALEARQEEVVWLLLWLGSGAATGLFPEAVVRAAEGMGLPRRAELPPGEDVRFVRDESGRTAADVCLQLGPPWSSYVEGGLFS
ncbi:hypothetical protein VTK56DRAFT_1606 [Thermocarpiscus australiensis]